MKKTLSILAAATLCAALVGCSSSADALLDRVHNGEAGNSAGADSYDATEQGAAHTGKLGEKMTTYFFDFSVDSAEIVTDYNGFTPSDGNTLLDAVVTVINTYDEELPMYSTDFQVQWGPGDDDYGFAAEDTLTMDDCMPDEYPLAAGESGTYHMVFEVPADATEFSISYLEEFEGDTTGDCYFVDFTTGTAV